MANIIGGNTKIIFTVKNFFTLIGTIMGLFFGFYQLVITPKLDRYEKQIEIQNYQNRLFYEELSKINSSIGSLNSTIENVGVNKIEQPNINTSGSFNSSVNDSTNH